MSNMLIDESPLLIIPSLATVIGLNESILLQQVHYWLITNRKARHKEDFFRGKWWCYNKLELWQKENFPFWSLMTIRRTIKSLEEKGLLLTCQPKSYNRTKYYSIDYEKLEQVISAMCSNCTDGSVQDEQITTVQDEQMLTETTTETTNRDEGEGKPSRFGIFSFEGKDDSIPEIEPKKERKPRALADWQKDPRMQVYYGFFKLWPKNEQRPYICNQVQDLQLWKNTVEWWMLSGYKPMNIKGMLDVYKQGGPKDYKSNGNSYHNNQPEREHIAAEEY